MTAPDAFRLIALDGPRETLVRDWTGGANGFRLEDGGEIILVGEKADLIVYFETGRRFPPGGNG